ncbi:MAG: adenylate/guanylate cyclase domain-containing protein, partial [bacterium]|nr:adenylate/guanylate cyclase domain-containing protein [bacterium]
MKLSARLSGKMAFISLIVWILILAALPQGHLIRILTNMAVDGLFNWRGTRETDPNILIVGFDKKTHRDIHKYITGEGQHKVSPFFWNPQIGTVIEGLAENGANVIALDLIQTSNMDYALRFFLQTFLQDKDITIPTSVIREFGLETYLLQGIKNAKEKGAKLILTFEIMDSGKDPYLMPSKRIMYFAGGTSALGFANIPLDTDAVVRRYILYTLTDEDTVFPSLALQIASNHTGKPYSPDRDSIVLGDNRFDRNSFINFYGGRGAIRTFSFIDVLKAVDRGDSKFMSQFDGATVLLGSTSTDDVMATPFSRDDNADLSLVPGIEVQASMVQNLVTGTVLKATSAKTGNLVYYLVLAIGFLLFLFCPISLSSFLLVLLTVAWTGVTLYAFKRYNCLLPMIEPVLAAGGAFSGITLYKLFVSERKRRFIRHLFGQYINEQILSELMSNPQYINLEGELREVTILFADLRDFTIFSEKNKPEIVVSILNRYFEEMTEAIMGNNGIVDKFIGDGIMAFFGAPLGSESHALEAVGAAIDMKKRLKKLNGDLENRGITLRFGIGIHSGLAIVGN